MLHLCQGVLGREVTVQMVETVKNIPSVDALTLAKQEAICALDIVKFVLLMRQLWRDVAKEQVQAKAMARERMKMESTGGFVAKTLDQMHRKFSEIVHTTPSDSRLTNPRGSRHTNAGPRLADDALRAHVHLSIGNGLALFQEIGGSLVE